MAKIAPRFNINLNERIGLVWTILIRPTSSRPIILQAADSFNSAWPPSVHTFAQRRNRWKQEIIPVMLYSHTWESCGCMRLACLRWRDRNTWIYWLHPGGSKIIRPTCSCIQTAFKAAKIRWAAMLSWIDMTILGSIQHSGHFLFLELWLCYWFWFLVFPLSSRLLLIW